MIYIKSFQFNFFQENTFLLYDETGEAVIIDCGCCRKEEEDELSSFINENKLTVKHLLCTHLHLDHIFGNGFVHRTYGLNPEAHQADEEQIPSPNEQGKRFGLPFQVEEVPIKKHLTNNEVIRFGNNELKVITVPGHSPGSVVFYNEKEGFLIAGDAIFAGSIGRTDLWGGNMEVLIAALKNKILTLPDDTIIYPGHGPSTTVIDEKLNNPYL